MEKVSFYDLPKDKLHRHPLQPFWLLLIVIFLLSLSCYRASCGPGSRGPLYRWPCCTALPTDNQGMHPLQTIDIFCDINWERIYVGTIYSNFEAIWSTATTLKAVRSVS